MPLWFASDWISYFPLFVYYFPIFGNGSGNMLGTREKFVLTSFMLFIRRCIHSTYFKQCISSLFKLTFNNYKRIAAYSNNSNNRKKRKKKKKKKMKRNKWVRKGSNPYFQMLVWRVWIILRSRVWVHINSRFVLL